MTGVQILLPPILRPVAGGMHALNAEGSCITEVLIDLANKHPALGLHIFDEAGSLRRNIVFLHDGVLVRACEAKTHLVVPGDKIVLTNALAGG